MKSAAQRQRQLAVKTARRKAIVADRRKFEAVATTLAGRVRAAAQGPIVRCAMTSTLFQDGIGYVVVLRKLPSGLLGCANFLVDVEYYGVKDVFFTEVGPAEFRSYLEQMEEVQTLVDVAPAYARKLLRDVAAYAAGLGQPPAEDVPVIEAIFGDVDADSCTEVFSFGAGDGPLVLDDV